MKFETYEPETPLEELPKPTPVKPLPQQLPTIKTKGYPLSRLIIALVLGIIIGVTMSTPWYMTDKELLNLTQESFNYGTSYGMEYTLAILTNQSIQCNQMPINYSGYAYTLYPLECLNLNQEGGNK